MQFSQRTSWDLHSTPYAAAMEKLRAGHGLFFDLTLSNPTVCGFGYDEAKVLRALSRPECLQYNPDPQGLPAARLAVAEYYSMAASARVDLDRIFLTTSTSEAYSYLFRLHCDPGDQVLVPQPSYPLFEFLADLDDVRLVPYPLFYDHGWHIDLATLEAGIAPQTRAVVVVHPNNPTGHYTSAQEREALEQICHRHGLALIVDEVFLDYALAPQSRRSFVAGDHPALTYVLSGLSKIAALPQVKAAWIAAAGPAPQLEEATRRLEVIADTFLSMNAPVQHALPCLLTNRGSVQRQICGRIRNNIATLDRCLRDSPAITRLEVQGGWNAVLRVPAIMPGETLAIELMRRQQVIVHPGYFYGFDGDGWVVLSLLPHEQAFAEGVDRLVRFLGETQSRN